MHHLYRAAELQIRRRRRKRLTRADRVPLPTPNQRLERWSMDFTADTLADGRCFQTLNIVDDFTREAGFGWSTEATIPFGPGVGGGARAGALLAA